MMLFLTKKGANLIEAAKTLNTIGKLSKELKDEKKSNALLKEQNKILTEEKDRHKKALERQESKYESLLRKYEAQAKKIAALGELLDKNNKTIKALSKESQDLDEWKEVVAETLSKFTNASPQLIQKLTGRDNREPGQNL